MQGTISVILIAFPITREGPSTDLVAVLSDLSSAFDIHKVLWPQNSTNVCTCPDERPCLYPLLGVSSSYRVLRSETLLSYPSRTPPNLEYPLSLIPEKSMTPSL